MKTLFSIILACTLQHTYAQVQRVDSVYNILMQAARPSIQAWVANTAAKYKNKEVSESSIKATEDFNTLGNFTPTDIDALCFLVMVQVAKNNETIAKPTIGLKNKPTSLYKPAQPIKKQANTKDELSEETQLQLQTIMDKRSKAETMLSNIMKKINGTLEQVVANLK
jgi:predicted component of type VI protein secretion system